MFPPITESSWGRDFHLPTQDSYGGFKVDGRILRGHKVGQGCQKELLTPGQPDQNSSWSA